MPEIVDLKVPEEVEVVRQLLREYECAVGVDLCFQNFQEELMNFPGDYIPPSGRFLVYKEDGPILGCVALRAISNEVCEIKRLYVKPECEGKGVGRKLIERILREARSIGYKSIRLDTLPSMEKARKLYRDFGFCEIDPYRFNPVKGVCFMELEFEKQMIE